MWTLNCVEMFVKVAIVIFLSLETESCAPSGIPQSDVPISYDRIMRVLKPAPDIEVDSS